MRPSPPHGDLRRRLVTGQRSAAFQAPLTATSSPPLLLVQLAARTSSDCCSLARFVGVGTRDLCPSRAGARRFPFALNRSRYSCCFRLHTAVQRAYTVCTASAHLCMTQRHASPCLAPRSHFFCSSLRRWRPTGSTRLPDQIITLLEFPSSPRCCGRKGTGLPPAPQLRGPRSTTSIRSLPGTRG